MYVREQGIDAIALSLDGKYIASRGEGGQICVQDCDTGDIQFERSHVQQGLTVLAWSPNNQTLAAGKQDGSIKIWDIEKGDERMLPPRTGLVA